VTWLESITAFGGVGLAIAGGMLVVAAPILPKGERGKLRLPLLLLALHVGVMGLRSVAGDEAQTPLRVTGVFLLLMSQARSGFLLLHHAVVAPTFGSEEVPKILRDLVQGLLFIAAALVTLRAAGVEPSSLFTTSALLTAVVGFALQDTLGNLFAGLAIQAQRPFRVGDWIRFDDDPEHIGQVVEINWRAVKVETLDHFEMTVPNATLAKASVHNYSTPYRQVRRRAYVEAPYDRPPERIMPELTDALRGVEGVLDEPPPSAIIADFSERGVRYEVRYFIADFATREHVAGRVRERLWYALQRLGVSIPVPQRMVAMYDYTEERLEHEAAQRVHEVDEALRRVDFLRALPEEARHQLAEATVQRLYAPGEQIIEEGGVGAELFIVRRGAVAVEVGPTRRQVARLGPGQFFGEMALMTGAERSASIRAIGRRRCWSSGRPRSSRCSRTRRSSRS